MPLTDKRPVLIIAADMTPANYARLEEHFTCLSARTEEERFEIARTRGAEIDGIVMNGNIAIPGSLIDLLPNLSIISAQGVGYEGIDLPAARARNLALSHGPGTNADTVADHALTLMLAVLREIPNNDALVREGRWRDFRVLHPMATGKTVGILGMGDIGSRIAKRCAGFDMEIAYHNRREKPGTPYRYVASVEQLAAEVDVLIDVLPGGAATRHIVDAGVLAALGPQGVLVNIGRGVTVDTEALMDALENGTILGAGLDVVESEPNLPARLKALRNVVLTPHIGGLSPEATLNANRMLIANLRAHFAGRPLETPIPA
ncbi:2-hydroxyacid dehydrogenase [Maritimibacter alkaliphilus]|uniref:2-hydroxyacid dehydrogenase n=1 Tax=Maritimibacter alkaliphilus TaxID=404236 RepID=UPI001C97CB3F|nr:2-hydroxyacid dehydrogenase [Maritimibacter alkaliphilus]MBY6092872.1 2-hydroxyacid dehydrogenase [Maritimibacter alkaliphilus]